MKAITIWQPWASLLACGAKMFETRSWATKYRGKIAIHAGKRNSLNEISALDPLFQEVYKLLPREDITLPLYLPQGCIIATAELVGCHLMELCGSGVRIYTGSWNVFEPGQHNELLFGDWTPGRYAWEFANMTMLPEPIPEKGKQRIWEWEASK